jgi:hypothetical protein
MLLLRVRFYADFVRALPHIGKTAAITDLAWWECGINAKGATKAKIHASDEQTGQPFEQQSRRTVHAEREQLSVIADNPVLLVAAVSVSISRRRAGGQKKKRP